MKENLGNFIRIFLNFSTKQQTKELTGYKLVCCWPFFPHETRSK